MLLRSKSILRRKSAEGTVWVGVPAPIGGAGRSCPDGQFAMGAGLMMADASIGNVKRCRPVGVIRDDSYFSAEESSLGDEGLPLLVRMQVKIAVAYRMAQTRSVNSPK